MGCTLNVVLHLLTTRWSHNAGYLYSLKFRHIKKDASTSCLRFLVAINDFLKPESMLRESACVEKLNDQTQQLFSPIYYL